MLKGSRECVCSAPREAPTRSTGHIAEHRTRTRVFPTDHFTDGFRYRHIGVLYLEQLYEQCYGGLIHTKTIGLVHSTSYQLTSRDRKIREHSFNSPWRRRPYVLRKIVCRSVRPFV